MNIVTIGLGNFGASLAKILTAMGHDPNEGEPGPISLQGDHGPIEFRNIVLTALAK